MINDYLAVSDAAELLKVNPGTLRRWDTEGKLPAAKINDRGDRRWRRHDLLAFIQRQSPNVLAYYGEYEISLEGGEFKDLSRNFGKLGKYILKNGDEWSGYAFACAGLNFFSGETDGSRLRELAEKVLKDEIDSHTVVDGLVKTYEYIPGGFHEVTFPSWWEGPSELSLVPELKIVVRHIHQLARGVEAWRCIMVIKSKNGSQWVTTQFGLNREYSEYAVEVTSEYLEDFAKSASDERSVKIFSLNYLMTRFGETKDTHGQRDITRITEDKVACWGGKCVKGSFIDTEELPLKFS